MTKKNLGSLWFRSGINQHIQVGVDLFKRIGQEKNANTDQEKTAHDVDHFHISFHSIKSRQERIKSQGRKKEWNSQAYRVVGQQQDSCRKTFRRAGIDENGGKNGTDTGGPPCGESNAHKKWPCVTQGLSPHLKSFFHLQKRNIDDSSEVDTQDDDEHPSPLHNPVLILSQQLS